MIAAGKGEVWQAMNGNEKDCMLLKKRLIGEIAGQLSLETADRKFFVKSIAVLTIVEFCQCDPLDCIGWRTPVFSLRCVISRLHSDPHSHTCKTTPSATCCGRGD